jgi:hypothetical protein
LDELKQQALGANPYTAAYRAAAQRYNAFGEREKKLIAQRDKARGDERMRLADELRAMIPEGARLQNALNAAKTNYTEWKKNHAAEHTASDPNDDEQVKALKQRLAPLEARIHAIVKQ